jgi:molecular chaperone GrpE
MHSKNFTGAARGGAFLFDWRAYFKHTTQMDEQDEIKIEPETDSGRPIAAEEDGIEDTAEAKIAKVRGELEICRKDKQEYMDGWQRAKADYVNALKRFENDMKSARQSGLVRAVETLLPAFDALERSKEHGDIPEGFLAIARQLESGFTSLGLAEIGRIGEPFNPAFHEALGQDTADNSEDDDTVTAVLEKGWKIGDMVVRPAKVRVAHYAS